MEYYEPNIFCIYILFGTKLLMKAICLISRAFREVAALEIWSKRNGGGRKLTIFSAPSARWTDGAEKSSFPLKTGPGTSYYIQSFITNIRSQPASFCQHLKFVAVLRRSVVKAFATVSLWCHCIGARSLQ